MTTDRLFSEFVDAWNAGQRPRVEEFLARLQGDERAELRELLAAFLGHAPAPRYSEETIQAILSEPALDSAVRALEGSAGLWPSLLPRLRTRARIRRSELVHRLAEALGVRGKEEKVAGYYHRMEQGLLPAEGVSDRVLEALGDLLGQPAAALRAAGGTLGPGVAEEEPAVVFARTARPDASVASAIEADQAELAAAPEGWDEVDELFRGKAGAP